jgi:hypothetical protein
LSGSVIAYDVVCEIDDLTVSADQRANDSDLVAQLVVVVAAVESARDGCRPAEDLNTVELNVLLPDVEVGGAIEYPIVRGLQGDAADKSFDGYSTLRRAPVARP